MFFDTSTFNTIDGSTVVDAPFSGDGLHRLSDSFLGVANSVGDENIHGTGNNSDNNNDDYDDAHAEVPGTLSKHHIEPMIRRQWSKMLSWVTFHPDEVGRFVDHQGRTALHLACLYNAPLYVMEAILFAAPHLAGRTNGEDELPLHWAIRLSLSTTKLRLLLQHDPVGGFKQDKMGQSPLSIIWERHEQDLSDVYSHEGKDKMVLLPCWIRMMEIVNAYNGRNDGADSDKQSDDHNNDNIETCHTNAHDDENDQDPYQHEHARYPLHAILQCPCPHPFVEFLVTTAFKDTLRQPDDQGNLPLHAAAYGQSDVVVFRMLLNQYPQAAQKKNHQGRLPLHVAIASKAASFEAVQLLLSAYPSAVGCQDPLTGLYPFLLAAATDMTTNDKVWMNKRNSNDGKDCDNLRTESITFMLLQTDPGIIAALRAE